MLSQRTMWKRLFGCFSFWIGPHETGSVILSSIVSCDSLNFPIMFLCLLFYCASFFSLARYSRLCCPHNNANGNAAFVRTAIAYIRSSRILATSMIVQLRLNHKPFRFGRIHSIIKFPTNARAERAQQKRFLASGKFRWTPITLRATKVAIAHI